MQYKRLEIYTGWKCNHKCVFCIEYATMEKKWEQQVTKEEMMYKLLKFKKKGYNHVTFLGGEPFIHPVLHFATRFAKKLGYTTLVTTNASTLQFEKQAEKHLPSIDQLIISIPIIDIRVQPIINDTKGVIDFEKVFQNIHTYWSGNFLKVNTVINKYNLDHIGPIIHYIGERGVTEMSITYPDLNQSYHGKKWIKDVIAPSYTEVAGYIQEWYDIGQKYSIKLMFVDIPLCFLPNQNLIQYTDDFVYQNRLKINAWEKEWDREKRLPRARKQMSVCKGCKWKNICWGPAVIYKKLYDIGEIKPIPGAIESGVSVYHIFHEYQNNYPRYIKTLFHYIKNPVYRILGFLNGVYKIWK